MSNINVFTSSSFEGAEVDLSVPENFQKFMRLFGDEDVFSREYPRIYKLFCNARNGKVVNSLSMTGFQNGVIIPDLVYDHSNKCIYASSRAYLNDTAMFLCGALLIKKNGTTISSKLDYSRNVSYLEIDCNIDALEPPSNDVKYEAELMIGWLLPEEDRVRIMSGNNPYPNIIGDKDYVKELKVNDPAYKKSTSGSIRVSLIREDGDVDYNYMHKGDKSKQRDEDNNVKMYLNMSGSAVLNDNHSIHIYDDFLYASLNKEGYGTLLYLNEPSKESVIVSEDGKILSWSFDEDWKNSIPKSVEEGNREYTFDMILKFYCNECKAFHYIKVSSHSSREEAYSYYKKIPSIIVLWGCLAKGTIITLANGTEKSIENIVEGDMICSATGEAVKVTKLIKGTESKIYNLCLESGECVRATLNHPFYTDNGLISVEDITVSTKILTKSGLASLVKYCYPENYNGDVFSIETEGGVGFLANGIVSGTHFDQGRLSGRKKDSLQEIKPLMDSELINELEKLKTKLEEYNSEVES